MRKRRGMLLALAVLLLASGADASELTPMMRQNYKALMELQRYVADPEKFDKTQNYASIAKLVDQIAAVAHALPQQVGGNRPGLTAVSVIFSDYLSDLQRNLKTGHPAYLRNRIRTATGFCLECHTGFSTGASFQDADRTVESLKLSPEDTAEFYASTRQFDRAVESYRTLFKSWAANPPSSEDAMKKMSSAVRTALSMSVRVKDDPKLTDELLAEVLAIPTAPGYFKDQLRQWRKDTAGWMKERSKDTASADDALKTARSLADRAKSSQKFPADHSGDISYLRSTLYANRALASQPSEKQRAEAFYLLGNAYAVLENPLLWELDDYYFEACVKGQPHTPLARQCFEKFSEEAAFGFSGSAGTDLPAEEKMRLQKLRALAESSTTE